METTEKLLEKLSGKLNEVYDPELQEELTNIFVNLVRKVKEDNHKYFSLARKLAELQMELEKMGREKKQAEYKEYFWKILREEEKFCGGIRVPERKIFSLY